MAERRENKLGVMPVPRLVLNVSLPLMVSLLVQSLYNIVDSIFVAQLSEKALTATSLAYPAQLLMIAVSVGTGVGVNSLLSRSLGGGHHERVAKTATNGLMLALASALLFMLLGGLFAPGFIGLFTEDSEIAALGSSYLRICMLLCPGIFIATTVERMLQSTGNTGLSMVAQVSGAVINIILDPILIFGWLGMPEMGIRGAAVATVIGQWAAAILALVLNRWKNKDVGFQFKGFRPDRQVVGGIYRVGAPTMLVQTAGSIMLVGMNVILSQATAVAAFGVYYKLQNFAYMPVMGLGQGLIPIAGFNFGAKKGGRIAQAVKVGAIAAAVYMVLVTLLFQLIPVPLMRLFDAGDDLLSLGVRMLRIISVSFIPGAMTLIIGYAMSGMGNATVSMVGTLIRQVVVLLPLAWVFGRLFGVDGMWFAFWVSELAAMAYALVSWRRIYRQKVLPLIEGEAQAPQEDAHAAAGAE